MLGMLLLLVAMAGCVEKGTTINEWTIAQGYNNEADVYKTKVVILNEERSYEKTLVIGKIMDVEESEYKGLITQTCYNIKFEDNVTVKNVFLNACLYKRYEVNRIILVGDRVESINWNT